MSYRVYLDTPGGVIPDSRLATDHPAEAEEHYFRLCRTPRSQAVPLAVKLHSDLPEIVAPGYYRLDADWSLPREQEHARWRQVWATPAEGGGGPTVMQVRGLARLLGWTGAEAGRQLGVTPRTWRGWLEASAPRGRIPWTAWRALLSLAGLV